jgi:hypothetical protein
MEGELPWYCTGTLRYDRQKDSYETIQYDCGVIGEGGKRLTSNSSCHYRAPFPFATVYLRVNKRFLLVPNPPTENQPNPPSSQPPLGETGNLNVIAGQLRDIQTFRWSYR